MMSTVVTQRLMQMCIIVWEQRKAFKQVKMTVVFKLIYKKLEKSRNENKNFGKNQKQNILLFSF